MPRVVLRLPVGLSSLCGSNLMECQGETVAQALADCVEREPRLRPRIFRENGSVWVGVFLNGRNVRHDQGLETPLAEGDEIRIVPPLGGG